MTLFTFLFWAALLGFVVNSVAGIWASSDPWYKRAGKTARVAFLAFVACVAVWGFIVPTVRTWTSGGEDVAVLQQQVKAAVQQNVALSLTQQGWEERPLSELTHFDPALGGSKCLISYHGLEGENATLIISGGGYSTDQLHELGDSLEVGFSLLPGHEGHWIPLNRFSRSWNARWDLGEIIPNPGDSHGSFLIVRTKGGLPIEGAHPIQIRCEVTQPPETVVRLQHIESQFAGMRTVTYADLTHLPNTKVVVSLRKTDGSPIPRADFLQYEVTGRAGVPVDMKLHTPVWRLTPNGPFGIRTNLPYPLRVEVTFVRNE